MPDFLRKRWWQESRKPSGGKRVDRKERADISLVRRGLAQSREKAQAMIMAGEVYAGERKISKSSETVSTDEDLYVFGLTDKYVSRGAYKLEKAVHVFN